MLESQRGVSRTPLRVLKESARTLADPWRILKESARTLADPWRILKESARILTDPSEGYKRVGLDSQRPLRGVSESQ